MYRTNNVCYVVDNKTEALSPLFYVKSELFKYLRYQHINVPEFDAACSFIIDTGELDVETIKSIVS